jgi:hypothetical protein
MRSTPLRGRLTSRECPTSRGRLLKVFKWVLREHSEAQAI